MPRRWRFDKVLSRYKRFKRTVPKTIATVMRDHYKGSFRRQGWTDKTLKPWPARDPDRSPGRAILFKGGDLRGSIKIKMSTFRKIRVGSYGIEYATFHNRGKGKLKVRKFVGKSKVVTDRTIRILNNGMKKVWRP